MKRIFDIILSSIAIVLFIPLFIIVSIFIKTTSKGPIIFKQERSGINRKPFYIYKFRSMKSTTPSNIPTKDLVDPVSHITKVGKFIRKTSIDELPQLFNILKGEMSFVGPRPLLCSEVDVLERRELYNANSIRPGLTGLAQINGRDILDSQSKAKIDGDYMMRMGLLYDFKIICNTFFYVFSGQGIKEGKD